MKLNTHEQYIKQLAETPYFDGRWPYYSVVGQEAEKMNPGSVLELGAAGFPIFVDGTTMDIHQKFSPTVKHDGRVSPWPFKDKTFDLFISLQVWEHLDNKQGQAFNEVRRVAKSAILSFPYKWKTADPLDFHNNLDETIFAKWTGNLPARTILIGTRMIYIFDTL
jgi:hypothetical protein